jgi:hypothetical protein
MKLVTRIAFALLFVPLVASAQFRDLDAAMSSLDRGFGSGDVQAIVSGIGDGEKVMLQFPGMSEQSGFFGRDQATYLLDSVFNKVKPSGFEQVNARKSSADGQFHVTARWTITTDGHAEVRDLYVTLQKKGDHYSVASVRSASK